MAIGDGAVSKWAVGSLTIHRVVDLELELPADRPVPAWCQPAFAPSDHEVLLAFAAYAITGAGPPIVVDPWLANDGPRDRPDGPATLARLLDALDAIGCAAGDVAQVANTHLDGIGWNTRPVEGGGWEPTFPNAQVRFTAANVAFHSTDDRLEPLRSAGALATVDVPVTLAEGVTMEDAPGHEDGHAAVWVRSEGEVACIPGHLFISPLQVADPAIAFDNDAATGEATRRAILGELAQVGGLLLSPLLGGPGGGRVRPDGDGWMLEV